MLDKLNTIDEKITNSKSFTSAYEMYGNLIVEYENTLAELAECESVLKDLSINVKHNIELRITQHLQRLQYHLELLTKSTYTLHAITTKALNKNNNDNIGEYDE